MGKQARDPSYRMNIHTYLVKGRARPTDEKPNPTVYGMVLYCPNKVEAKSLFWKYSRLRSKVKRATGEILSVRELVENNNQVKNYGICLKFPSRSNKHNMYKEYRDTTA